MGIYAGLGGSEKVCRDKQARDSSDLVSSGVRDPERKPDTKEDVSRLSLPKPSRKQRYGNKA